MRYFLIDLERSVASGAVYYWKQNRHGYTRNLEEAGRFLEEEADRQVKQDFDARTIKVAEKTIENILKS